jgi:hypothetical protein
MDTLGQTNDAMHGIVASAFVAVLCLQRPVPIGLLQRRWNLYYKTLISISKDIEAMIHRLDARFFEHSIRGRYHSLVKGGCYRARMEASQGRLA